MGHISSMDFSAYGYIGAAIEGEGLAKVLEYLEHYSSKRHEVNLEVRGKTLIDLAFTNVGSSYEKDSFDILQAIVKAPVIDINLVNSKGQSALSHALALYRKHKSKSTLKEPLESVVSEIRKREDFDITVLFDAPKTKDNIELLDSISPLTNDDYKAILLKAIETRDVDVIKYLIENEKVKGRYLNESVIKSLIHNYRIGGYYTEEEELIDIYSGPELVEEFHKFDYAEMVQLLLPYMSQYVNVQTKDDYTLLHAAVERGDAKLAAKIIEVDAVNLELKDSKGATPLKRAYVANKHALKIPLIKAGAKLDFDVGVRDAKGLISDTWVRRDPLEIACDEKRMSVAEAIVFSPHFKPRVNEGERSTLMTAYNSIPKLPYILMLLDLDRKSDFITVTDFKAVIAKACKDGEFLVVKNLLKRYLEKGGALEQKDPKANFIADKDTMEFVYKMGFVESGAKQKQYQKLFKKLIATKKLDPHMKIKVEKAGWIFSGQERSLFEIALELKDRDLLRAIIANENFKISEVVLKQQQKVAEFIISQTDQEYFIFIVDQLLAHSKRVAGEESVYKESKFLVSVINTLIKTGGLKKLSILVEKGVVTHDLLVKSKISVTELYKAGEVGALFTLIKTGGLDLNVVDSEGNTLLSIACANGHFKLAKLLVEQGADIHLANKQGLTPFMQLCLNKTDGAKDFAKFLLSHDRFAIGKERVNGKLPHVLFAYMSGNIEVAHIIADDVRFGGRRIAVEKILVACCIDGDVATLRTLLANNATDVLNRNSITIEGQPEPIQPIFLAFASGNHDVVIQLIAEGIVDVNAVDPKGYTLFHYAASAGVEGVVKALLARDDLEPEQTSVAGDPSPVMQAYLGGYDKVARIMLRDSRVDPNATVRGRYSSGEPRGSSLLALAAAKGDLETIKILRSRKRLDINYQAEKELHPLVIAYENGKMDVVLELLKDKRLDPNQKDTNGNYLLFTAYARGETKIYDALRHHPSIDLNVVNEAGNNLFMLACMKGDFKLAYRLVVSKDFDISHVNELGQDALNLAVAAGNAKLVDWLLGPTFKGKFDVNREDSLGNTPLLYAYGRGDERMVQLLMGHGAKPSTGSKGKTLLMAACAGGKKDLITPLLDKASSEDLDAQDVDGNTALHYAISNGNLKVARLLISKGASVDIANYRGFTPLMLAIEKGDIALVKELMAKGANINAVDKHGNTVLMHACLHNQKEIIQIILENRALDINHRNEDGMTAFMIAAIKGNLDDKHKHWKGDREILEMLLDSGADPSFGSYYKGLGERLFYSMAKATGLSIANNCFNSFNPLMHRVGKTAVAVKFGVDVYHDVSDSVEKTIRGFLNEGTERENSIDLDGRCMVGLYHRSRFGFITSGLGLKSMLKGHAVYKDADKGLFTPEKTWESAGGDNLKKNLDNHNILTKRYIRLQHDLKTKYMWPWERSALTKVAEEMIRADKELLAGYRYQTDGSKRTSFQKAFPGFMNMLNPKVRDSVIIEMLKDGDKFKEFSKLANRVLSGEFIVSPEVIGLIHDFNDRKAELKLQMENPSLFRRIVGFDFGRRFKSEVLKKFTTESTTQEGFLDFLSTQNGILKTRVKEIETAAAKEKATREPGVKEKLIAGAASLFGVKGEEVVEGVAHAGGKVAGVAAGVAGFAGMDPGTASLVANWAPTVIKYTGSAAGAAITFGLPLALAAGGAWILYKVGGAAVSRLSEGEKKLVSVGEVVGEKSSLPQIREFAAGVKGKLRETYSTAKDISPEMEVERAVDLSKSRLPTGKDLTYLGTMLGATAVAVTAPEALPVVDVASAAIAAMAGAGYVAPKRGEEAKGGTIATAV